MNEDVNQMKIIDNNYFRKQKEYYYEFLTDNSKYFSRRAGSKPYVLGFSDMTEIEFKGRRCMKIVAESSRTKLTNVEKDSIRGPRKIDFYFDDYNVWVEYEDSTPFLKTNGQSDPIRGSTRYKTSKRGALIIEDLNGKLTLAWRRYNISRNPEYQNKLENYIARCSEANQLL